MNFLAALESFVGVLYAGLHCAITFGKVQQIYSRARVAFSDACVIKFGCDLIKNPRFNQFNALRRRRKANDTMNNSDGSGIPYPLLMFRIVNEHANHTYGSISNLNLTVSVFENLPNEQCDDENKEICEENLRVCSLVPVSPSSIPLFDRIAYIHHVLDAKSPLLNEETIRLIEENKGKWPSSINTAEQIRSSIDFDRIIVSINAISDSNKAHVYARKSYTMEDMKIGWEFADMMFWSKNREGRIESHVDFDLLSFLVEQKYGEGENLDG